MLLENKMQNKAGFNLIIKPGLNATSTKLPESNPQIHHGDATLAYGIEGHGYAFNVLTIDNEFYFFYFEGIILDLNGQTSTEAYLKDRLTNGLDSLLKEINGSFIAVHICKASNKTSVICDHLATRKVYYRQLSTGGVAVSTRCSDLLVESLGPISLDEQAIYGFIGYGFFLDNTTYWSEIKTLRTGELIEFESDLNIREWSKLNTQQIDITFSEAVDTFENHFSRSIKNISDNIKNKKCEVIAAISGGLDSRASLMSLAEHNCTPNFTVTFSQSESGDDRIGLAVSNALGAGNILNRLDGGWYLTRNVVDYILSSQGRLSYQTAIHGYNTYSKLRLTNSSLLVSGQIGDVLFGSFLGAKPSMPSMRTLSYSGVYDDFIHEKIGFDCSLFNKYGAKDFELFNLEQRQANGTISGDFFIREFLDTVSPFFDRHLIQFSLAIPKDYRANHKLQFEWMRRHHPKMTEFTWDKSGIRPKNRSLNLSAKRIMQLRHSVLSRLGFPTGQNPFIAWLKSNEYINIFINRQIEAYRNPPLASASLSRDLMRVATESKTSNDMRRSVVLTVLIALHEIKATSGSGLFEYTPFK